MTSRILIAILLTLVALVCLATLHWQGFVAGAIVLVLAVTVFIQSKRWRAWVLPLSCLAFSALSASAGIRYLTGESVYLAQACTGSKKALCEVTNKAMLASGGVLGGLMWLCTACALVWAAYWLRRHFTKA